MNCSSNLRFGFGTNWQNYSRSLSEEQIQAAMDSLNTSLGNPDFSEHRILDAGCGSGLFSLAACRLGARQVVAFDYDSDSVACAKDLNQRFGPYSNWEVMQGDVLDQPFLNSLGLFGIVYSWGVLHHTGNMWQALENIHPLVKPDGFLYISIYNDQGWISKGWKVVKKFYVHSPHFIQKTIATIWFFIVAVVRILSGLRYRKPINSWFRGSERGMNLWHDVVDWVGGYPFETASLQELQTYFEKNGFLLIKVRPKSGSGCNELVFKRIA